MTLMSERPVQQAASPGDAATHLEPLVRAVLGPTRRSASSCGTESSFGPPAGDDQSARRCRAPAAVVAGRARADPGVRRRRHRHRRRHLRGARRARAARPPRGRGRIAQALPAALVAARRLGVVGGAPKPPPEEHGRVARRHSKRRDAEAIGHHYDVGNDFYRLVLGQAMTYSCARFVTPSPSLAEAQAAKHELVCRKLGLHERPGCACSTSAAAGVRWPCTPPSTTARGGRRDDLEEQATLARERVADAGLSDRVEIRLQDYRDLGGETFDAISSIGMFEHVGAARIAEYFDVLARPAAPAGAAAQPRHLPRRRLPAADAHVHRPLRVPRRRAARRGPRRAGHAAGRVRGARRRVAPRALRADAAGLGGQPGGRWDDAVALVGEGRARVWRLYMAASALSFEAGVIGVHQTLGVKPSADGRSGMPPTRAGWD